MWPESHSAPTDEPSKPSITVIRWDGIPTRFRCGSQTPGSLRTIRRLPWSHEPIPGELKVFFDIGPFEMVALVVLAVVIFGPDKLPKVISEVMGFIRKVREFSDSAKADIRQELGPEFQDLDFSDLTPRGFVKKNLLDNPRIKTSGELQELRELRNGFDLDGIRDDVRTLTSAPSDGDAASSSGGVDTATRDDSGSGPARRQDADERPPFDPDAT